MTENINGYFDDSLLTNITVNEDGIIMFERNNYRMKFKLQRFGSEFIDEIISYMCR